MGTNEKYLQEIRSKSVWNTDYVTVTKENFEWLMKQAKRVQELENIIYQDARQGVLEDLYEENKRYREVIDLISNAWTVQGAYEGIANCLEEIIETLEELE